MHVYRMVTAIALIFGVVAFAQFFSVEAAPEASSQEDTGWISANIPNAQVIDRKALIGKIKQSNSQKEKKDSAPKMRSQSDILREAGRELSREEAVKRFKSARNFWAADLTLTQDARAERLERLGDALFGEGADLPEETQEDLEEQERLRTIYATLTTI